MNMLQMTPEQYEAHQERVRSARTVRFESNETESTVKRKYRNKPARVDDIKFASQAEARRYGELRLLEAAGEIECLRLQPRYPLVVCGHKVCVYVADFAYRRNGQATEIVEDVKGVPTPVYKLKKKLMRALWGIEIIEP